MSDERRRAARKVLEEQLPSGLIDPMIRLHKRRERINLKLLPSECFILCGLLQMADRVPGLQNHHHTLIHNIVEQLIGEVANIEPALEHYMLLGWNPDHDQPLKPEGEK